eukprot:m.173726 g.173726  ORF g.173726 m.173726 type:complete len:487 (+) comp16742_c0_seq9:166-1626(+)
MSSVYEFEEYRSFASAAKLYRALNVDLRLSPLFLRRNFDVRHRRRSQRPLEAIIDTLSSQARITFELQGLALESRFSCQLLPLADSLIELKAVHSFEPALLRRWSKIQFQLRERCSSDLYALSDWIPTASELQGVRGTVWLRILDGTSSLAINWSRQRGCPSADNRKRSSRRRRKVKASSNKAAKRSPVQCAERVDKGLQHTPLTPALQTSVDNTCSADSGMEEDTYASPSKTKTRVRRPVRGACTDTTHSHVGTQTEGHSSPAQPTPHVAWPALQIQSSSGPPLQLELAMEADGTKASCPLCGDAQATASDFEHHVNHMHHRLHCTFEAPQQLKLQPAVAEVDACAKPAQDEFVFYRTKGPTMPSESHQRQYFHGHFNHLRVATMADSDDVVDEKPLQSLSTQQLQETADVNSSEASVMRLWNVFCGHHPINADHQVIEACREFVEQHRSALHASKRAAHLHFTALLHMALISPDEVKELMQLLK